MPTTQHPSFAPGSLCLRIDGIAKSFGERRVLADVSFAVSAGDRVGLIGENGSGKTTLLKIVAGLLSADAGTTRVVGSTTPDPTVGLLHQEPPFADAQTLGEAVESAVVPARQAVRTVGRTAQAFADAPGDEASARAYAEALDAAERLDAWTVDARIASMLSGLGLSGVDSDERTGRLSGGQRARLSLAWLLLRSPDILLLDEPTNHLDGPATEHLRRILLGWRGPVLVASHDRAFLDEAVTSLVDLDPSEAPADASAAAAQKAGVTRFTGTYSDYLRARAQARARWERRYRDEQAELKRLRASVREHQRVGHRDWHPRTEVRMAQKYYADRNAKVVARRVNDARSRLEDLSERQVRKPPRPLVFSGLTASGEPRRQGGAEQILSASDVAVAGRLAAISLSVEAGQKLLVSGPNGSGKSTLLHLMAGRLEPTSGSLSTCPGLRVGLLAQNVSVCESRERTARETYEQAVGHERAAGVPLSTFGLLAGRDGDRPLGDLSLGQRRRLELAILLADPPDLLLLDEPTNHLSLPLVTALERAIPEYPGAVVVASHDRWLHERWSGARLDLRG